MGLHEARSIARRRPEEKQTASCDASRTLEIHDERLAKS
jgi:hypothetical protein